MKCIIQARINIISEVSAVTIQLKRRKTAVSPGPETNQTSLEILIKPGQKYANDNQMDNIINSNII